jgi:hypothetical protein
MTSIHRFLVAGAVALVTSAPAFAQAFDAEISCGGVFAPGDSVSYKVSLEEQAFQTHTVDITVEIDPQGKPTRTVFQKTFTLNPNQDLNIKKSITLGLNALPGDYDMRVIADDGALVMTDTCSFQVN